MVLRVPRAFSVRARNHCAKALSFWNMEKSPRQLDHAPSNSRVARTRQPFLPAFSAALVGRAREDGITRYGPSVAHVSRQHLLHQHVGRLDANPDHARQQTHHCVWSITGRLLETLQASILDLPYLIIDEPPAHHVAAQLSQRVGRDRLALGRAQAFKALGGPLQLGIESADAEPAGACLPDDLQGRAPCAALQIGPEYPPAEPEALGREPLKAAGWGR